MASILILGAGVLDQIPTSVRLARPIQSYPGDEYVDWIALDGYPLRAGAGDFFATFSPDYEELLPLGKPMMVAETGINLQSDAQRASYITNLLTHELPNRFPRFAAFVWFSEP